MSFFTQTKVLDVVEGKKFPLISVDKATSVHDTLKILYDTGFSSLTVSDSTISSYPKHIAGFVDLLDILAYLITVCDTIGVSDANSGTLATTFLSKPVGDLMDLSTRDHFKAIVEEDDLLKVISILAQPGSHRVAVIDILSEVRHVLTQTDIVRVLHFNIDSLAHISHFTIKDLGIAYSNVISVRSSAPTLDSLKLMNAHKLSAVPIVNDAGILEGTLSISDLKAVTSESFRALQMATLNFAQQHSYAGAQIPKAVMVTPESTFGDVINLVNHARTHRVWVVDTTHKPIGVISLTDICRVITKLHEQ